MSKKSEAPAVIKKYANRRLYDTETSMYITLEDLTRMVREEKDFTVVDAKTGEDLTRQVLTQIILEQENKGGHVLPIDFMRSIIRFDDTGMRNVLQHYLEASMQSFLSNQEKMRKMMGKAVEGFSPFTQLEEITKQNVAMFERAFSMFNPFSGVFGEEKDKRKK